MNVRIVGAHQTETAAGRSTCLLVDDRIAIDAGSLAGTLTLSQQRSLEAILITHYHYDHIGDLPTIGLNRLNHGTLPVYALPEVHDALRTHIFNDVLWPDLESLPSKEAPTLRWHRVKSCQRFEVAGYRVTPIPANHTAPIVGYLIEAGGRRFCYTGDTHGGVEGLWNTVQADVIITETTLPNRLDHIAKVAKHLTPARLEREIEAYKIAQGVLPRIVVLHVNEEYAAEIAGQLAGVSRATGAEIHVSSDDEVITI